MVKVLYNKDTKEDVKLESGEFRAEFGTTNSVIDGISLHFYSGSSKDTCTLHAIKPEDIDDLTDLVSQLRVELRKRNFNTSYHSEEKPNE